MIVLRYRVPMGQKIWTARELSQLSPAEQDEIFEASIISDLADVPPEFLSRVRDRLEQRTPGTDVPHRPQ